MSEDRLSSQIRVFNALPRRPTKQSIPEGKWSLSSLSGVPYVKLTGPGGYEKEFSWGEFIEVPKDTLGALENSSYHPGDIVLNSGWDCFTLPRRVTVPFESIVQPIAPNLRITPSTPVDTRRARRAWFVPDFESSLDTTIIIRGFAQQRSHQTGNSLTVPGVGYEYTIVVPAFTEFGPIPLGYGAALGTGEESHALLDYASFEAHVPVGFHQLVSNVSNYYILEY